MRSYDDDAIRTWLRRSLEHAGYTVTAAHDMASAGAILAECSLDAMILDLRLGEHSGVELLDLVRGHQLLATIPVLMLTGVARMTEIEELTIRRHGASIFYKPVAVGAILRRLERVLATSEEAP